MTAQQADCPRAQPLRNPTPSLGWPSRVSSWDRRADRPSHPTSTRDLDLAIRAARGARHGRRHRNAADDAVRHESAARHRRGRACQRPAGRPESAHARARLALLIFGAFVVKDVAALLVQAVAAAIYGDAERRHLQHGLLEGYLTAPYWWHLRQNTGDKLWTVQGAVAMGYAGGLTSALGALTELLTITFIFASLLVISPAIALSAALYFGVAAFIVQRMIRPRIHSAGERTRVASQAMSKSSLQSLTAVKEIRLRSAHQQFVDEFREEERRRSGSGRARCDPHRAPVLLPRDHLRARHRDPGSHRDDGGERAGGPRAAGLFVAAGTRVLPSSVRLISALSGVRYAYGPLEHLIQVSRQMRCTAPKRSPGSSRRASRQVM